MVNRLVVNPEPLRIVTHRSWPDPPKFVGPCRNCGSHSAERRAASDGNGWLCVNYRQCQRRVREQRDA